MFYDRTTELQFADKEIHIPVFREIPGCTQFCGHWSKICKIKGGQRKNKSKQLVSSHNTKTSFGKLFQNVIIIAPRMRIEARASIPVSIQMLLTWCRDREIHQLNFTCQQVYDGEHLV